MNKRSKKLTIILAIVFTSVLLTLYIILWQAFKIIEINTIDNSDTGNPIIIHLPLTKKENKTNTTTSSLQSTQIGISNNNTGIHRSTNTTNAPRFDTNNTFAACLLVKDDTRRLPEWLAYHYTVLPLGRLILAGDPYSISSPRHILQQFQNQLGIEMTIWNDGDYMYNEFNRKTNWAIYGKTNPRGGIPYTSREIYDAYIWRQKVFLTKCVQQLAREGRHSWIVLVDTDEFVTYNWYRPEIEGIPLFCSLQAEMTPGRGRRGKRRRKRINTTALEECHSQYKRDIQTGVIPRGILPSSFALTTLTTTTAD